MSGTNEAKPPRFKDLRTITSMIPVKDHKNLYRDEKSGK